MRQCAHNFDLRGPGKAAVCTFKRASSVAAGAHARIGQVNVVSSCKHRRERERARETLCGAAGASSLCPTLPKIVTIAGQAITAWEQSRRDTSRAPATARSLPCRCGVHSTVSTPRRCVHEGDRAHLPTLSMYHESTTGAQKSLAEKGSDEMPKRAMSEKDAPRSLRMSGTAAANPIGIPCIVYSRSSSAMFG